MRELLILLLITFSACSILGSGEDDDGPPRTIVFSSNEDGRYHIYSMREDGSGIKQLTDGEYNCTSPAWSPNGERIAYVSTKDAPYGSQTLWVMDADGSNKKPLVEHPSTGRAMFGNHPSWSPNGTKIAFDYCSTCGLGGKNQEVFLADLNSGTIDTLTNHSAVDSRPTWSPDGSKIAFSSNRDYFDADSMRWREDLYLFVLDDGKFQRITNNGNAKKPVWSPDGTKIAYEWDIKGNEIFLYNLSSEDIRKLKTGLKYAGNVMWNKDGTALIVTGREYDGSTPEMRLIDIKSGSTKVLKTFKLSKSGRDYDWYTKN